MPFLELCQLALLRLFPFPIKISLQEISAFATGLERNVLRSSASPFGSSRADISGSLGPTLAQFEQADRCWAWVAASAGEQVVRRLTIREPDQSLFKKLNSDVAT
ncbi:hypothetical protein H0176_26065 [Methylorubrum populi]|uniref:Uncharacterized protein n=1 Tax=Methylorubrum rhodesianum TaxID=29427 RepID=A0ABU9ZI11_9HYPH|nr:hypothetical protein [Methylorubrum rhodesianum]MBK3406110.1 hypothetical protein [Methylorubrum rhodesianum]MBY0143697.1 hypothetical protein [Methylorubrum populi]